MQWSATAPSNIALIKYMGKNDAHNNVPANASLSYTLDHLTSTVVLGLHDKSEDAWEPLTLPGTQPISLDTIAQQRFLQHLQNIKQYFGCTQHFMVQSANNFPHSSGLASSASSFAALTKCAVAAICELMCQEISDVHVQAMLSQKGSGSSCRSFYAPWALWNDKGVSACAFKWQALHHQVIVVSRAEKEVSSSRAHQRVKTSPYWPSRTQRAKANLQVLLNALEEGDWHGARNICWQEFTDMHQLFSSASEPFQYINSEVSDLLALLQSLWQEMGDGPIVTMDAGPNIHLLYRLDQKEMAERIQENYFAGKYEVL